MPPDTDNNDIPSMDDIPIEGEVVDETSEELTAPGESTPGTSGSEPLQASPALDALGRRAIDVFALGLESVAAQKPQVTVLSGGLASYAAIGRDFVALAHFGVEVRFALNETEAQPVALLVPFEDMGRIFMMSMAEDAMADDAFAAGQVDLVSQGTRELLDLAGLMLFIDELAGGEATLATVRLRGIEDTLAMLQSADPSTQLGRFDLLLALPDGSEARVTVLVPASLISRLDALVNEQQPARRADPPPLPRAEQTLRAVGGSEPPPQAAPSETPRVSEMRAQEPDVAVHPVRFPPLSIPDQITAPPQQLDLIMDVPLRVSVELGRSSMTVEDVLALGPGSVIELNKLAGEPVDVLVNDRLIARGEVVVVDENFGVRVTEVISPRSRATAVAR